MIITTFLQLAIISAQGTTQEAVPMTLAQIQQATLSAVTICEQIEQIGASKSTFRPPYPIKDLFTKPELQVTFEPSGLSDMSMRLSGFGGRIPHLHLDQQGNIVMLSRIFGLPPVKQTELPVEQLKGYLREAVGKLTTMRNATSYDLEELDPPYGADQQKAVDPNAGFFIYPKTNGIKWGPGGWGHGFLLNYTGEIETLVAGSSFTAIEMPATVMTEEEASNYAAQVVLSKQEVGQTNVAMTKGKMITGNPYIGGEYYKSNVRINAIKNNNIGVQAYQFYMGDGRYSANGDANLAYDVLIDAKTGDCLRMLTFMTLSRPTNIIKIQPVLPAKATQIQVLQGSKTIPSRKASLVKVSGKLGVSAKSVVLKTGKLFTPAKMDSKQRFLVGSSLYVMKS